MTKINTLLKQLGLTSNQTYLYLQLAKLGKARAGELIKKTGFHRNIVYGTLEELIELHLVSATKVGGVLQYRILDPHRLVAQQEERVRIAKTAAEELATFQKQHTPQQILIYEGQNDFQQQARASYAVMPKGGTLRLLGTSPSWHSLVGDELGEELLAMQKEKPFLIKILTKELTAADKQHLKQAGTLIEARESTLVADNTNGIEILPDRISIRSFVPPFFIVEVVNEQLAKNYQNYFDFLWKTSDKQ